MYLKKKTGSAPLLVEAKSVNGWSDIYVIERMPKTSFLFQL